MSPPTLPAAVLFDMDGTLVDTEPLWDAPLYAEANYLGTRLTPKGRAYLIGKSMNATAEYLIDLAALRPTRGLIEEINARIRERVAGAFTGALPWRPGAREFLEAVRAEKIPTGLVTSTERRFVTGALRTLGTFGAVVCGDEVEGHTKPDPEPYRRAAWRLGVNPSHCVAVEDSPTGSDAAVAAGCKVIVVPHLVEVQRSQDVFLRTSLVGLNVAALAALWEHTPIHDAIARRTGRQQTAEPGQTPESPAPSEPRQFTRLPRRMPGESLPAQARGPLRSHAAPPRSDLGWFASESPRTPA